MKGHKTIYIYGTLYNNITRIDACIKSIEGFSPYKLFIVDNHSNDGSYEYLLRLKRGYMESIGSELHVFRGRWGSTRGKARDTALKRLYGIGRPKDADTVLYVDFDVIYKKPFINLVVRESKRPSGSVVVLCGIGAARLNRYGWKDLHIAEDFERLARMKKAGVPIRNLSSNFHRYGENDEAAGSERRYLSGPRYYTRTYRNLIDNERGLAFKSFREFYSQSSKRSIKELPVWLSAYLIARLLGVYSYDEGLDNRTYVLGRPEKTVKTAHQSG